MYLRFVIDPYVPNGIRKVIKKAVKNLSQIFPEVIYTIEQDDSLGKLPNTTPTPFPKIFQRKMRFQCQGLSVYILNGKLSLKGQEVLGVSRPDLCAIGIGRIARTDYDKWSSKIWELILHECGHSFGLVPARRRESFRSESGTWHCLNNCVMNEEAIDFIWTKKAKVRFLKNMPYCQKCLTYLLKTSK